ncbi:hypothetical protein LSH36_89g08019 [Paralvinella palmiformis]|uniref:Peptidoglycan recognition protein family domain-containing protein n=1 Tax=Paralvinella palmiformis TaxID=53620 RepID=A0AAD9K2N2_9ANNE|nr:hypothetical protein LSH36_89g08019 [Paralvinella palmiformis]
MLNINVLLCGILAFYCIHNAYGFLDVHIHFSKGGLKGKMNQEQCSHLDKSMVKREEWDAMSPRQTFETQGIGKDVIIWQTGSETCNLIGLGQSTCERCLHDAGCIKRVILALQKDDLDYGLDDIKYHFLIDEEGVIYEGRGWDVAGQHAVGVNARSIDVAVVGDFTHTGPSEAAQDSLNRLILCGMRSSKLLYSSQLIVTPSRAGRAFYDVTAKCHGLCVAEPQK